MNEHEANDLATTLANETFVENHLFLYDALSPTTLEPAEGVTVYSLNSTSFAVLRGQTYERVTLVGISPLRFAAVYPEAYVALGSCVTDNTVWEYTDLDREAATVVVSPYSVESVSTSELDTLTARLDTMTTKQMVKEAVRSQLRSELMFKNAVDRQRASIRFVEARVDTLFKNFEYVINGLNAVENALLKHTDGLEFLGALVTDYCERSVTKLDGVRDTLKELEASSNTLGHRVRDSMETSTLHERLNTLETKVDRARPNNTPVICALVIAVAAIIGAVIFYQ